MANNYFQPGEFNCRCDRGLDCDAAPLDLDLLTKLSRLRTDLGKKMVITSAERCAVHNDKIGGSNNSFHLLGRAVDVKTDSAAHTGEILKLAIKHGFNGVGISKGFIHLDTRLGNFVVFGY